MIDNDKIDSVKDLFKIIKVSNEQKLFIILDYIIERSNIIYFLTDLQNIK
jgi:hypothetical protein